jgi:hypothetical protein
MTMGVNGTPRDARRWESGLEGTRGYSQKSSDGIPGL